MSEKLINFTYVPNGFHYVSLDKEYKVNFETEMSYWIKDDEGDDFPIEKGGNDSYSGLNYVIYEIFGGEGILTSGLKTSEDTSDNPVNPSHYKKGDFEVIDVIKVATEGASGIEAVCQGNIIKYVMRYREKNGVTDLKKARWYLDYLIDELEAVEKLEEGV